MPSACLKQLYLDSLVYSTENLRHLIKVVGADRIVIGTDFPFNMSKKDSIDHVLSIDGLSDSDRESIFGGTAKELLVIK